jgi:hypothetical protein
VCRVTLFAGIAGSVVLAEKSDPEEVYWLEGIINQRFIFKHGSQVSRQRHTRKR